MNEIYKTLAEGYEKLAAGYRALAKDQKDEKVEMAVPAEPEKKEISIEEVRAVLAAKTQAGKRQEVKELLLKYGTSSEIRFRETLWCKSGKLCSPSG